jgi:hypothetical protein
VPRLPRLRRPRLRRRPINASTEPEPLEPLEPVEPPPQERISEQEAAGSRLSRPRLSRKLLIAAAFAALIIAAVAIAAAGGVFESGEDQDQAAPAPVTPAQPPRAPAAEERPVEEAAAQLGFPALATKNTTRVGGSDPAAIAAGVALATFPSAGGVEPPQAVSLVNEDDWAAGIAAAVLMAEPLRAPLLLSSAGGLPEPSEQALAALSPEGSTETRGAQAFAIGGVEVPGELQATRVEGRGGAAVAAAIDRLRARLTDADPEHIVLAPLQQPRFAMPAAAWAARSGDPVLFAAREQLPKATEKALRRHPRTPVYVLGPSSAISSAVVRKVSRIVPRVRRVSGEDPVTNAIELARYANGNFGWNINDPGHGFVLARSDRPLDAAAAAPLSAGGTWGPLLLTDSADTVPGALRGYLLDVKPGYRDDPTRAFYNHVWIIGDETAIDVGQQAAIDDLAELTRIGEPSP